MAGPPIATTAQHNQLNQAKKTVKEFRSIVRTAIGSKTPPKRHIPEVILNDLTEVCIESLTNERDFPVPK